MPAATRTRLVEAAFKRFYHDGFRNVGLDQIIADVGISKTAFYKHFASKEDLMLAAMEMQNDWLQETFRSMVNERGATPVERLQAAFDVVEFLMESEGFKGCFFVNVAMEFPLPHEPAHILAVESKQAIEQFVYELAVDAGASDPRALRANFAC